MVEAHICVTNANQAALADRDTSGVPVHALIQQFRPVRGPEHQRLDAADFKVIVQTANVRIKELVGEEPVRSRGGGVADALPRKPSPRSVILTAGRLAPRGTAGEMIVEPQVVEYLLSVADYAR